MASLKKWVEINPKGAKIYFKKSREMAVKKKCSFKIYVNSLLDLAC